MLEENQRALAVYRLEKLIMRIFMFYQKRMYLCRSKTQEALPIL